MMTYPSKALGLIAAVEWGLGDIEFPSPYFFSGTFDGKRYTFHAIIVEHFNTMVDIPVFEEDFIFLLIKNKRGDNLILLTKNDCMEVMGTSVDFEWVAPKIKKRIHVTVKEDILS